MISIVGSGRVGAAIAFLCVSNALDDVLLLNRTKDKAIGESLDIAMRFPPLQNFLFMEPMIIPNYQDLTSLLLQQVRESTRNLEQRL